jgi:hypothetical protein
MRKLQFALLFAFVISTNAEYIWNGSDWIWKDEKVSFVPKHNCPS